MMELDRQKRSTFDWAKIDVLGQLAGDRLESLLDHLGLRLHKRGRMLVGPCPVHGGDRSDAFNLYPDGHTIVGNWKCRSRSCHLEFKGRKQGSGTLIGLVWGVLSHQRLGWSGANDKKLPFAQVIDYLCEFVGKSLDELTVDVVEREKNSFAQNMSAFGRNTQAGKRTWAREQIRARMEVPAPYYLLRGYSPAILDRYDVGQWKKGKQDSSMVGRMAVPVFDPQHKRVVGLTARSPWEKCSSCGQFHGPDICPPPHRDWAKWLNNEGFRKELHLYNYWFAHQHIRKSGVVVLVEGPGDVWRLEEAGIHNAVASFGCELSDPQQIALEQSGALTIVHFPHADQAGQTFRRQLEREMGRLFRLCFLDLPRKDVGEMSVGEVREVILPFLEKVVG